MKTLNKIPTLKVVGDAEAAQKLRELLKDADDGLRRVVRCGLYIEWIAANLPHGQFMPWLEQHCPDVGETTTWRWRTMAKNICEWAGFKFSQWENLPASNALLLDCPVADLPANMQQARVKMDSLLDSAKTPKQLFFNMGFKQGELDGHGFPKAKVGRAKGSSGVTKIQRNLAAQRADVLLAEEREEQTQETIAWLLANADALHAGGLESRTLARLQTACQTMSGFCGRVLESRK